MNAELQNCCEQGTRELVRLRRVSCQVGGLGYRVSRLPGQGRGASHPPLILVVRLAELTFDVLERPEIGPDDHSPPGVHANRCDTTPCVFIHQKKNVRDVRAEIKLFTRAYGLRTRCFSECYTIWSPRIPIEATQLAFVATPRVVTSSWCHPYETMSGVRGGVSLRPRVPKITA